MMSCKPHGHQQQGEERIVVCKYPPCGQPVPEHQAIRLEAFVRGPRPVSIGGNYCSTGCAIRAIEAAARKAERADLA